MANVHNYLLEFERSISLSASKKKQLIASRKALQQRVVDYFKAHARLLVPRFYIQGSYKMGTMVMDSEGTYDVDVGVYFLQKPNIEPLSLQKNVFNAVKGHTVSGLEHRDKCIRVVYKGDFDIDIPVYYKTPSDEHPYLATKNGWMESDPKELCDWFDAKKDRNGQLVRLVKYFKSWANNQTGKMPSGIAFTVWIANNFRPDSRDDKAFFATAKSIESEFGGGFRNTVAMNPVTPKDNLLKLDFDQRSNFKSVFRQMLKAIEKALSTKSTKKAATIWAELFGEKFPVNT